MKQIETLVIHSLFILFLYTTYVAIENHFRIKNQGDFNSDIQRKMEEIKRSCNEG